MSDCDDHGRGFSCEDFHPRLSHHQEGESSCGPSSAPLGLTLNAAPSFVNLVQKSLDEEKKKMDGLGLGGPAALSEKSKASNIPALYIRIGSWERMSSYEADLTAKIYYAKRKLVWEVLRGPLKYKIEFHWSNIAAIRAITPQNELGTLEIQLNEPPLFYREINNQPKKQTLWKECSDFTGRQAITWRNHSIIFRPGILDKHYLKLLQSDQRLLMLTVNPFPPHDSLFFHSTSMQTCASHLFNAEYPYQPPNPTNPMPSYDACSSLHQPPIQALDYSNTNRNQLMGSAAMPWCGEVRQGCYDANVEQQSVGDMDMDMDIYDVLHDLPL